MKSRQSIWSLALVLAALPAHATFPGKNGQVTYARCTRDLSLCHTYAANLDSTHEVQLFSGNSNGTDWSADGNRVVIDFEDLLCHESERQRTESLGTAGPISSRSVGDVFSGWKEDLFRQRSILERHHRIHVRDVRHCHDECRWNEPHRHRGCGRFLSFRRQLCGSSLGSKPVGMKTAVAIADCN
jgi:hypothetical protein